MLGWLCVLLLVAGAAGAESHPDNRTLTDLRAERRAAMRAAVQAKSEPGPVPFGLLVIPVDFADQRFEPDFQPAVDLLPRLAAEAPGSLAHYYDVASQGRARIMVQLAPVVSLEGTRLDYSDLYWQGNERGRLLAGQALARAAALGVDFAASDLDADGEVDGVLLLHAAPGLENDPDGLLVPSQFFLEEPVVQRGTLARSYALAAARSSLGLWAHETGHLLGLEDRYDLGLVGSTETGPRGGLGMFSLMASGWLGTGAGEDPSLLDAYSALQLGWADLVAEPGPGQVVRLLVGGAEGPEYFLASQRYPEMTAPYDAALPAQRLLLLHVDETLAEGQASGPAWPDRHLRVMLVQASGEDTVARGLSQGQASDLLPTSGDLQDFNDGTEPSSRTWTGQPSGVDILVEVIDGQLDFLQRSAARQGDLRLSFSTQNGVVRPHLELRFPDGVLLPPSVQVTVTCQDTTWGRFAGGVSLSALLAWQEGDSLVPPEAATWFSFAIQDGQDGSGELVWLWDPEAGDLDLGASWPGDWTVIATESTTWHRWLDGPSDQGLMLACTGASHASGADWPEVQYGNSAHAVLLSPWLGTAVAWVEMTHALDLELLHPGVAIDGVALSWLHAAGKVVPAEPADGWLGRVDARTRHRLAGLPTFALADSLQSPGGRPLWRREVVPLPDPALHGSGPWRLQLELASNSLWRARGWLVRDVAVRRSPAPASGFPVAVSGEQLVWSWEGPGSLDDLFVESSQDGGETWARHPVAGWSGVPLTDLPLAPGQRSLVRILAVVGNDLVASRSMGLTMTGRPSLGRPWPNPAASLLHVPVDGAGDERTRVDLYDVRGRRVKSWRPGRWTPPARRCLLGPHACARKDPDQQGDMASRNLILTLIAVVAICLGAVPDALAWQVHDPWLERFQVGQFRSPEDVVLEQGWPEGLLDPLSVDPGWRQGAARYFANGALPRDRDLAAWRLALPALGSHQATQTDAEQARRQWVAIESLADPGTVLPDGWTPPPGPWLAALRKLQASRAWEQGDRQAAARLAAALVADAAELNLSPAEIFVWALRAKRLDVPSPWPAPSLNLWRRLLHDLGLYDTRSGWAIWVALQEARGLPALTPERADRDTGVMLATAGQLWLTPDELRDAAFPPEVEAGLGGLLLPPAALADRWPFPGLLAARAATLAIRRRERRTPGPSTGPGSRASPRPLAARQRGPALAGPVATGAERAGGRTLPDG